MNVLQKSTPSSGVLNGILVGVVPKDVGAAPTILETSPIL
jgi:hypothetical protein